MNGTEVVRAKSVTDLGIIVDEKLTWNDHIDNITRRANQRLGLGYPRIQCEGRSKDTML